MLLFGHCCANCSCKLALSKFAFLACRVACLHDRGDILHAQLIGCSGSPRMRCRRSHKVAQSRAEVARRSHKVAQDRTRSHGDRTRSRGGRTKVARRSRGGRGGRTQIANVARSHVLSLKSGEGRFCVAMRLVLLMNSHESCIQRLASAVCARAGCVCGVHARLQGSWAGAGIRILMQYP
jgi:hypothetical protein